MPGYEVIANHRYVALMPSLCLSYPRSGSNRSAAARRDCFYRSAARGTQFDEKFSPLTFAPETTVVWLVGEYLCPDLLGVTV